MNDLKNKTKTRFGEAISIPSDDEVELTQGDGELDQDFIRSTTNEGAPDEDDVVEEESEKTTDGDAENCNVTGEGTETDADVQALYDAPSEDVVRALHSFFGNQSEQDAVSAQRKIDMEKVQKENKKKNQADAEDDLIIGESVVKTDEQKLELRRNKINNFLDWFIRLKSEILTEFKVAGSDYITESVSDEPFLIVEKCKEIAKSYKENGSIEELVRVWELDNIEQLITAICIGVLEMKNDLDIDFSILCDDRIDEWNISKCIIFLDNASSGVNSRNGPLKLMQFTLTSPASAILLLTMLWLRENGYPCRYQSEVNEVTNSIIELDSFKISNMILNTSVKYWDNQTEKEKIQQQISSELDEFFREIETTAAENQDHFENTFGERNEILDLVNEKIPEFSETDVSETDLLTPEQREELIKARAGIESLKAEMELLIAASEKVYSKKSELEKFLILRSGDYCLARAVASDETELSYAIVQDRVDVMTYKVKFLDTNQVRECNIRDLAITHHGMYDPIFNTRGDVGLRVACRQVVSTSQFDRKTVWLTGTTAGRRRAHKGDFLVFFDNGSDAYVTAPTMPNDTGYEIASNKNGQTCFSYKEMMTRMNAAQIAVMVGQPLGHDGELDLLLASHWVRQPNRAAYIRDFMKEFPEWPLLKMQQGMRYVLYNSLVDRRKRAAYVVGLDRAFAIVRYESLNPSTIGAKCMDYPCNNRMHVHVDERIYRGSHRLEGAAHKKLMISTNNNLSKRRKDQLSSQFEPTDMVRTMPERSHLQLIKKRVTGSGDVVTPVQKRTSEKEIEERKKKQLLFNTTIVPTPVIPTRESLKAHAQCGPDCLRKMDADPYESRFHKNSPLHTPLLCGWRRQKYTMNTGKKRASFKHHIIYFAPCGKPLYEMSEISQYLHDTRSMLTIDCFSYEPSIKTDLYVTVDEKYVKDADFSKGDEGIPVPLVNTVDDEEPPKLDYSRRKYQYDNVVDMSTINRDFCSGCSCEGDCSDALKCECQQLSIEAMRRLPHNLQFDGREKLIPHYQHRLLSSKVISGLYECNDQCSCHRKSCHNRVVQNNIKYPMQIFKTAQSGWGCRALTDIPRSTFICTYVGALLTNELAESLKNEDQYFADLDLKDCVEEAKTREDHETDFGYGGEESDYNDDDENDESCDDAKDLNVVYSNGSSKNVGSIRTTRQSENNEQVRQDVNDEEKESGSESGEIEKEQSEVKEEPVFHWDEYFEKLPLYVLDAKHRGNLGRFLNHSCDPNVHVQHVLYDTHDLRLPWVAFFTCKHVKAGDELSWDYHYTQNGTETAQLTCHCGADNCSGRLLKS